MKKVQTEIMDAQSSVINNHYLLELILLELDQKTILISAQRACRSWRELINESCQLQQHLFLRPAPKTSPFILNPLLAEKFPHWFPAKTTTGETSVRVFKKEDLITNELSHEHWSTIFRLQTATWRRMYPVQPPIWSFGRHRWTSQMGGASKRMQQLSVISVPDTKEKYRLKMDMNKEDIDADGAVPFNMESLYRLVTSGTGDCHTWAFAWDDSVNDKLVLPERMGLHDIDGSVEKEIRHHIKKDGVVLLECRTRQCTGKGPWKFERQFVMGY